MKRLPSSVGFTVIELLIVVSILGVLLGIGVVQLRPNDVRLLANDVKAQVEQARYEAIMRNRPIAIVWDSDARAFETRVDESSTSVFDACEGARVLRTRAEAEYRSASVVTTMEGIVWLPTGQGRTCAGRPDIGTSISVTDGRITRTVVVSSGGRVGLE